MKRKYYFNRVYLIVLFIVLTGCVRSRRITEPLFLYQELQDSIDNYVLETLPILESAMLSPASITVIFRVDEGDTLVVISPANSPFDCRPGKDTVLGVNVLGGHVCEVVVSSDSSYSFPHLSGIINNKKLLPALQQKPAPQTAVSGESSRECDYKIVERAAELRRFYILNRPEHLKVLE